MAVPTSRNELIEWCLKKLGAPVIEINVADEQLEDRVDEALLYFRDYHFDGVEKCYLKHKITTSSMNLSIPATGTFLKNDVIQGETSDASGFIYDISEDGLIIRFKTISGSFVLGENIINQTNTGTATISNAANSITIGDIDNQYIPVSDRVVSIVSLLQTNGSVADYAAGGGMFDPQYQFALNNMYNFMSTDIISYTMFKQNLNLWNFLFKDLKRIRFNRKTNKLFFDTFDFNVDQYIVIEAYVALDPEQYTEAYNDEFVREYTYSLIKRQWGENLKKYSGIQLPGGTTLNGKEMFDEAVAELNILQERLRKEFQEPPHIVIG